MTEEKAMFKIEVNSEEIKKVEGTSKRTQQDYRFFVQPVRIFLNGEIRNGEVTVEEGNPYRVGTYVADPKSIYFDRNGRLALSLRLQTPEQYQAYMTALAADIKKPAKAA